jgi:hypothetical protein
MKRFFGLVIILLASAVPALADASAAAWTCEGANIEIASVGRARMGTMSGNVSWDCWPGGGLCQAKATLLSMSKTERGDIDFKNNSFELVVYTSIASKNGVYNGYLSATDLDDPVDAGHGMTIDEPVTCTETE